MNCLDNNVEFLVSHWLRLAHQRSLDHCKHGLLYNQDVDCSAGSYGIPEGILFSYPVRSKGDYKYEIVQTLELNEFGKQKIRPTREELEMETEAVSDLLG